MITTTLSLVLMMVLVSKEYINPWGKTYKEKNQFQEYFIAIVESVKSEDWSYVKLLTDELTNAQKWDLWWRLASYTRRAIQENNCIDMRAP